MPSQPAGRLSSRSPAPSDFESQLQTLAFEATRLDLVPATLANLAAGNTAWVHGPWDPQQCALVLLRWLDADLVVVLESTTTQGEPPAVTESRQLTYDEARSTLGDPTSWSPTGPPGTTLSLMYNGERALEADDEVWWVAARAGAPHALDGGNSASPRVSSHATATQELKALTASSSRQLFGAEARPGTAPGTQPDAMSTPVR